MPPERTVLAFDTSGPHVAVALCDGDVVLASRCEAMAKGQAERLMPLIGEVLAAAERDLQDVTLIAVGIGPGNFTGVRIAVSAARGLALGLDVPAVGVSGLEAAALDQPRPVTAVLPAPRGQSYVQRFDGGAPVLLSQDETPEPPVAPTLDPEALVRNIARIALRREGPQPRPAPLYLRPADAAPPKDPAPVLLP